MTTTALDHPAVRAYLAELRRLLGDAPDRDLVVDGVSRHIEDALADGPVDGVRVRSVLDELGDPAVIAAEAVQEAPARSVPFLDRRAGGVLTVLLLTVGGFVVPVVGWIVGLGLLWSSRLWTVRDKLVATLAPAVLAGLGALVGAIGAAAGAFTGWVHLGFIAGLLIGVAVVAVHLLRRARPRPE